MADFTEMKVLLRELWERNVRAKNFRELASLPEVNA